MSAHEPAFPFNELNDDGTHFLSRAGLTKREYFAGLALQGLLSGSDELLDCEVAQLSVWWADNLIAALNGEPQP